MGAQSPRPAGSSPERAGPSAPGDVVGDPAVAPPNKAARSGSHSLAIGKPDVRYEARKEAAVVEEEAAVVVEEEEVASVAGEGAAGAAQVEAQRREVVAVAKLPGDSEEQEERQISDKGEAQVVEAAARLQISNAVQVDPSFVPVKDVKVMLQTGRFEGVEIAYWGKKEQSSLLNGVIHGTSYFCTCGDCKYNGKALTAKAFEHHAYQDSGYSTHNPNAHIVFGSSTLSLFEACRMLKEAKSEAYEEHVFGVLSKTLGIDLCKSKTTTTDKDKEESMDSIVNRLEAIEKKIEGLENIQSQVSTLEKSVSVYAMRWLGFRSYQRTYLQS